MADVNIPAEGQIGIAPPADAPIETAQPLQPDAGSIVVFDRETRQPTGEIVDPHERARQNERELEPLAWKQPKDPSVPAPAGLQSPVAGKTINDVDPFYKAVEARKAARAAELADPSMPAASNTDSPSRGLPGTAPVPRERTRAALKVEGGFGAGESEYFPLNGAELKTLIEQLMDEVNARIQNDLRFSMAATYPRLTAKVQIVVEAEAGTGFEITKIVAHDKTPLEVAQQHGDSVVFVVVQQRREFNEADEVETPPDAIRDELGVTKPRQQYVKTGMGRAIADFPVGF